MRKIILVILLTTSILNLTGCGFHLRGHEPIPVSLRTLALRTNDPYSAFTKQLQQTLRYSKVCLVANAPFTLQILGENFTQLTTSMGSGGYTTTYLLTDTVSFQLLNSQQSVLGIPQVVTTTRNYSIVTNQVVSDNAAIETLRVDMRRELIFQLLNRLRSPKMQAAMQQCGG